MGRKETALKKRELKKKMPKKINIIVGYNLAIDEVNNIIDNL